MQGIPTSAITRFILAGILTLTAALTLACREPVVVVLPATPDVEATVVARVEATAAVAPTDTPAPPPQPTAIPIPAPTETPVPKPTNTPMPSPTLESPVTPSPAATALPTATPDLAAMVQQVKTGVVRVRTNSGSGTGFVFETTHRGRAYVLTNHHVIQGAGRAEVLVNDASTYQGTVLGYDAYRDLAVLEICCGSFNPLSLQGSQVIKPGAEVVAIGYPLGIEGSATVTRGIVSAYRYDDSYKSWVVQTDAPINPGNSGGPLLLSNGETIGINTFIIREDYGVSIDGVGFAISRQSIQSVLEGLKQGSRVAFPTPTPKPTPSTEFVWRTYTKGTYANQDYGYSVRVPWGWEIEDSYKDSVSFRSPDRSAGFGIGVFDSQPASSISEFANEMIESSRAINEISQGELFEVVEREILVEEADGSGAATILYRYKTPYDSCVKLSNVLLGLSYESSFVLSGWVCEHSYDEYESVLRTIVDSLIFK